MLAEVGVVKRGQGFEAGDGLNCRSRDLEDPNNIDPLDCAHLKDLYVGFPSSAFSCAASSSWSISVSTIESVSMLVSMMMVLSVGGDH